MFICKYPQMASWNFRLFLFGFEKVIKIYFKKKKKNNDLLTHFHNQKFKLFDRKTEYMSAKTTQSTEKKNFEKSYFHTILISSSHNIPRERRLVKALIFIFILVGLYKTSKCILVGAAAPFWPNHFFWPYNAYLF